MMEYLRRGKATESVFARTQRATSTYHTLDAETTEEIPVETARLAFLSKRSIKMSAHSDGTFVFIDGNPWGYTRYVLFP